MHQRDILYTPDFVINAAGLIEVAVIYDFGSKDHSDEQGAGEGP